MMKFKMIMLMMIVMIVMMMIMIMKSLLFTSNTECAYSSVQILISNQNVIEYWSFDSCSTREINKLLAHTNCKSIVLLAGLSHIQTVKVSYF